MTAQPNLPTGATDPYQTAPALPVQWNGAATPVASPVTSPVARACPACGRDWGAGIACQFCAQVGGLPSGVHVSSAGRRFGGYLLEAILMAVTLYIGWFIWCLISFSNGQTPAKQVLGMRCVRMRTGESAGWGTMFLREVIAKPVIGLLSMLTFGIINFWLVWDKNTQELWDKMAGTLVVNDPNRALG